MVDWYDAPAAATVAAGLSTHFREVFGREPDGVWAAPGRVNVIGEHVDYNGGLCLPFALPHRTYIALAARRDERIRVESMQAVGAGWTGALEDVAPGAVRGWAGYAVGVPWAFRSEGLDLPGFDAIIDGRVPLGAGLSSSAALECAVAVALDDVTGLGLAATDEGRARLARLCARAENDIAGAPTGGLDQAASLRSTAGHATLLDCRDFSIEAVPFDLAAAGLALLVIDTHAHHALVDGQYGIRRDACREATRVLGLPDLRAIEYPELGVALDRLGAAGADGPDGSRTEELRRRVRHVVTEIERVREVVRLCRSDDLRAIGPVLDASHASLRDDFEVSCPELDLACAAAHGAGALGARMVGGGFGGSAIALVPAESTTGVASHVEDAFTRAGLRAPSFLTATASAPAGRVVPGERFAGPDG
jgi:galactokinase